MIAAIFGAIKYKDGNSLVIDVSGVGYKAWVTTETSLEAKLGSPITLWTHLAVRENSHDLFGFKEHEELLTFELLITISGIGPKTALSILNVASPATLRQAVASGETAYLTRVSGIGKKNAEKIVLELKDKLKVLESDKGMDAKSESDALEALISLGYSERDARETLKKVAKEIGGASERVRAALKILASHA